MQTPVPIIDDSIAIDVAVASAVFALVLDGGKLYQFASTVACWIAQGATPTASAAAGSMYVPAGVVVQVHGGFGVGLAVIRSVGDGKATLTPITVIGV